MAEAKVQQFPCPQCSADMAFDPESGQMLCPHCGFKRPVAASLEHVPVHPYDPAATVRGTSSTAISAEALEVHCSACGSSVMFEPPEVAGNCPFCGDAIIAQPKAADPLLCPDGVLPAKVPKAVAQQQVQQWLGSLWFAPSALKRLAQQEKIGGVYLPFWTYDAGTRTAYRGQRGDHYWETESYQTTDSQGNSVTESRQVQRTSWSSVSGEVERYFENVLIPATRSVPSHRLDELEPWDFASLCTYEPAYLAGFKAQRYVVDLPEGFDHAKQAMEDVISGDIRRDIGGDEQRIDVANTEYSEIQFRHLLLPVWIGAYRFQGKVYQVLVNARTGEVQGARPYSAWKIAGLVIAILLVILLLILIGRR